MLLCLRATETAQEVGEGFVKFGKTQEMGCEKIKAQT